MRVEVLYDIAVKSTDSAYKTAIIDHLPTAAVFGTMPACMSLFSVRT